MAGHTHGATSGKMLWVSLGITAAFVLAEAALGLKAHSLALLSDAGHNASDALALGLSAFAIWIARRPAHGGKTFGYHRAAMLAALANASALVVISLGILFSAGREILHPSRPSGPIMIGVAAAAFVMNTVIARWLQGDSRHSLNARAVYIHMAGDAASSLAVVLAGVAVTLTGWGLADPIVSILIAVFILYSSWGILGEAANVLMEGAPSDLDVETIAAALRRIEPVLDVHDLHVWTVGDGLRFLSCHAVLPEGMSLQDASAVVCALSRCLSADFSIGHATIQPEISGGIECSPDMQGLFCILESASSSTCCSPPTAR